MKNKLWIYRIKNLNKKKKELAKEISTRFKKLLKEDAPYKGYKKHNSLKALNLIGGNFLEYYKHAPTNQYIESMLNFNIKEFEIISEEYKDYFNDKKIINISGGNNIHYKYKIIFVLYYLTNTVTFKNLFQMFHISQSLLYKIVSTGIYVFAVVKKQVRWNKNTDKIELIDYTNDKKILVLGAIDCTSFYKERIHPSSGSFYRCDKKDFFLTVQVICDFTGNILSYSIGRGN